jgi:hypothetical protein
MKKYFLFASILLISLNHSLVYGQINPAWIKYENRQAFYSDNTYFTGFSSETNYGEMDNDQLLEKCISNAKKNLVESVQVSIKSTTVSGVNSTSYQNNPETYEYIKQSSVSYSNIDINGLVSEKYFDNKKNIAYAFTYVKKVDLINLYKQKVNNKLQILEQMIQYAEGSRNSGQTQKAFEKLVECLAVFRELEEAQSILAGAGVFDETSIQSKKTLELKSKVDKNIDEINLSAKTNISDLAYFISNGLKIQNPEIKGSIGLSNFTYQDSKVGSPFAKRLNQELEQKLIHVANYNIQNKEIAVNGAKPDKFDYMITGTYWEENDYLKLIVVLRDFKTGKAEASIESKLSKDFCTKNNIQYLPEDYINAEIKNKAFSENEIVGGDLSLEVWTNKGNENLMYSENDTLRLYIRANKECYIRFIYYLADGSSVLLLDDYYIGTDKVNKVYKLPDEFICSSPFGVETLQVNAQTEKFEPLVTQKIDGYRFIKEDLNVIVEKSRGFKKLDNNKVLKSEKRIIITTMNY